MKIALLLPGGVERNGTRAVIPCLLWLIERLVEAGGEVHIFVPRQEPAPGSWTLRGATVWNAGTFPTGLRTLRALRAEHQRARFDIVHAFWAGPGSIGALASRLLDVPLVLTLAGGEVAYQPSIAYGGMISAPARLRLRLAAAQAQAVTAPSTFLRDLAEKVGFAAEPLILGVDLRAWPPLPPRPRVAGSPLKLLHVASLNPVKDQATLLQAMAILRDRGVPFRLDLVGEDAMHGAMQATASRLGLDALVRFNGFRTHDALRPWFEQADLLVMSSVHEAGPLVTLEAAVAGVPTVGTRVGHIADLSPDAALAVPVGDSAALAGAIETLWRDEPCRLALAAAAQRLAVEKDADFTAQSVMRVYHSLCGRQA